MTRYRVKGGFINLGKCCIAIEAIEAVEFIAKPLEQNLALSKLNVPQREFWALHVRVLLKSGNEIEALIPCDANTHSPTEPPNVMSCQWVEQAIRAAIRLEDE